LRKEINIIRVVLKLWGARRRCCETSCSKEFNHRCGGYKKLWISSWTKF